MSEPLDVFSDGDSAVALAAIEAEKKAQEFATQAGTAGAAAGGAAGQQAALIAIELPLAQAEAAKGVATAAAADAQQTAEELASSIANAAVPFRTWSALSAWAATAAEDAVAKLLVNDAGHAAGEYLAIAGVPVWQSDLLSGVSATVSAMGNVDPAPIEDPNVILAIMDELTKRWLLKGYADGSLLGDMRNRAGAVLASLTEAQTMADVVDAARRAAIILDVPPMDQPGIGLLIWDDTSGRPYLLGRDTGQVEGDLRNRAGEVLVSQQAVTDGVAVVGAQAEAPLDDPDIVLAPVDPTTNRAPWNSRKDGSTRGDWHDRSGVPLADAFSPIYAPWRLHNFAMKATLLRGAALGISNGTPQLVVALGGDSWVNNKDYWAQQLHAEMVAEFGACGLGFIQLQPSATPTTGSGINSTMSILTTAGWIQTFLGPAIRSISTSSAGERLTVTMPAGNPDVRLQAGGIGSIRYRCNAGSWTGITLPALGLVSYTLAGVPSSGSWTLEVESVSGDVTLFGLEGRAATSGVRFHKLGRGGASADFWGASADSANIIAGLAALEVDTVVSLFGTNDQSLSAQTAHVPPITPAQHGIYVDGIVDVVRAAAPIADILHVTSPECRPGAVASGTIYPMAEYSRVARNVARAGLCAHLDLQQFFGDVPADYAYGGPRALLDSSTNHPALPVGRGPLVEAFRRALLFAS